MTDKEKLTALMEKFSGGSQQVFAQLIGVPRSNIATWMHRNSITANGREAILDTFPQVSREWLMGNSVRYSVAPASKRADMLTDDANVIRFSREDLVPLYDECRASWWSSLSILSMRRSSSMCQGRMLSLPSLPRASRWSRASTAATTVSSAAASTCKMLTISIST